MSSDKKPKRINWHLLTVVVLVFVITVGAFWRSSPSDFQKAKNSIVNTAKNIDWKWTGFSENKVITTTVEKDKQGQISKTTISKQTHPGKTFWDWLELSSRLAVPILIAFVGYQVQKRDKEKEKAEQDRRENEQKDILAEEAIKQYLDNMANLLGNKELRKELFSDDNQSNSSDHDNSVRNVARLFTTEILRRLEENKEHQSRIINFLQSFKLSAFILNNANLSKINLSEANLMYTNLQQADLSYANLQQANLRATNLSQANLVEANLQAAKIWDADLLKASLHTASLQQAELNRAKLHEAILAEADLREANLKGAELHKAILTEADLREANLKGAKLHEAKLKSEQIKSACNWQQAIYKFKEEFHEGLNQYIYIEDQEKNQKYIEELKKDKSSDPKKPPDCSIWNS